MKTLYFDIDGTSYVGSARREALSRKWRLEAEIRKAGFRKLVCVGNFSRIAGMLRESGVEYDELGGAVQHLSRRIL